MRSRGLPTPSTHASKPPIPIPSTSAKRTATTSSTRTARRIESVFLRPYRHRSPLSTTTTSRWSTSRAPTSFPSSSDPTTTAFSWNPTSSTGTPCGGHPSMTRSHARSSTTATRVRRTGMGRTTTSGSLSRTTGTPSGTIAIPRSRGPTDSTKALSIARTPKASITVALSYSIGQRNVGGCCDPNHVLLVSALRCSRTAACLGTGEPHHPSKMSTVWSVDDLGEVAVNLLELGRMNPEDNVLSMLAFASTQATWTAASTLVKGCGIPFPTVQDYLRGRYWHEYGYDYFGQ